MTKAAQAAAEAIARDMVALFDASNEAYTCRAAIDRVIERPAQAACAVAAVPVRWRKVVNMAAEAIHERRYPSTRKMWRI